MAPVTEVFGFASGLYAYVHKKIIDYRLGMMLIIVKSSRNVRPISLNQARFNTIRTSFLRTDFHFLMLTHVLCASYGLNPALIITL